MELNFSVVMYGVTMGTSSLTSTSMSMPRKSVPLARFFPNLFLLLYVSEVPKERNKDSINLEAPRKRDKPTGDQEMVTVKKVLDPFRLSELLIACILLCVGYIPRCRCLRYLHNQGLKA